MGAQSARDMPVPGGLTQIHGPGGPSLMTAPPRDALEGPPTSAVLWGEASGSRECGV